MAHTIDPSSTPWVVVTEGFKDGFASVETEDGGYEVVLSCRHDNAAHIVKCVNSHDALVEALKQAVTSMLDSGYSHDHIAVKAANAAIAGASS